MVRLDLSLRRRRDLDFIRFIVVLINCVVVLHMLCESDTLYRNFLRIDRRTFGVLLEMVRDVGGLSGTKNMSLEEIGAGAYFYRSGETVTRQFHACLMAILKLHIVLFKKPTPIPEDCDDESVNLPSLDRAKYRTRKGNLAMNVLGVCSPEMKFIQVLPGWEGSAHDGRILQDVISRTNGLKWNNGPRRPQNAEEFFNLKHAQARNVIKRCFGLLKGRWGILRSPSWFSLQTHGRIVLACALLHNLIGETRWHQTCSTIGELGIGITNICFFVSCNIGVNLMDESSSSGGGRGRNKRFWSLEEDKALVATLSDLANDPHWKCDNGFRNGYMNRLEEVINKAIPGCGLKALPHIDSRLKMLGTKFRAIIQMLNTSGFKWDDEKHMISVERSVYDEYYKAHPNCKNLYGHVFPYLNALIVIYGKDYATGKPAEGFVGAIENMEKSAPEQVLLDSSDDDDVNGNETQTVESSRPSKKVKRENTSTRKRGKKEHNGDNTSELASLHSFMNDMNVHLSTMANVISSANEREKEEAEMEKKEIDMKKNVLTELLSLEGVTPSQALKVAQVLIEQPRKLLLLYECPDAMKSMIVTELIVGNCGNA
ncbi:hypothetical protein RND81_08G123700 [Saponaria officinalis]|uniref:Myb/SANT-like domain-containing protein n=1 Tax=Saponaria officinalis TaxID=3572 RepID=A0AAW1J5P6_SAPOF